jgi:hypothetical protein
VQSASDVQSTEQRRSTGSHVSGPFVGLAGSLPRSSPVSHSFIPGRGSSQNMPSWHGPTYIGLPMTLSASHETSVLASTPSAMTCRHSRRTSEPVAGGATSVNAIR